LKTVRGRKNSGKTSWFNLDKSPATSALEEQIAGIESELELVAEGNERKIELERQLQRAKHELAKPTLEDQRALLNAQIIEEEVSPEDRLDIIRRMREGYEELYGDFYRFSTEWQDIRKQEIELENELSQQMQWLALSLLSIIKRFSQFA